MPTFSIAGMMHQLSHDPNNPLLFNDGFFVYFFALFMAVYYAFRNKIHGRSIVVSLFSLYFFYKASGSFVLLVLFSAVANYWLSNQISKTSTGSRKKGLLATSVAVNLGMLFYFKYTNFFIGVLNDVGGGHIGLLHILLPVGISFFTFENLSYTIDVYRGEFEPEKKFVNYLLFLSFFPKVVMGPIVRAKDFIPQLYKPYFVSQQDFATGFYLIVSGLFRKLVIADYLTLNLVNVTFDNPGMYPGLQCFVAVLAYAIVIYCDFSGFSDVAIGIAKWMGITIPPNFLLPYQSVSLKEFWGRWHISLSSWLKDYLYIFWLGGSRNGVVRMLLNLMITMLLGGFWHGAKWTFIVWGALHGAGLVLHRIWEMQTKERLAAVNNTAWYNAASGMLTFAFVCLCWVFFKATDVPTAMLMLKQIATNFSPGVWGDFWANYKMVVLMMGLGFALHFVPLKVGTKYVLPTLERMPMYGYVVVFIGFVFVYAQVKSATPVMPIYLQF
jgi:D-alanyl-lipoteichoic acid acyltransferase DltB (MBOAT superfamily)